METTARILVVDDEVSIVSLVSRALAAHGFRVDSAADGERALQLVRTDAHQLVILDLILPGLGGVATLKRIMGVRPELPVLVLSALSDVESKVRCFELGASDYLTKPFVLAELLARVRAVLRNHGNPLVDRFLRVGSVTLDLQRHVADCGNGAIALSSREFDLLAFLMRRAGNVCSREQLLAEVWDCPFDPHTNVVDVYVRRLRSKLGGDVIETLRSLGYSLRAV